MPTSCFFDALFLAGDGGFIHVSDCFEVHLRNSLVRVNYLDPAVKIPIWAVKTTMTAMASDRTNVIIEGSSLYGPCRSVLDVGDNTFCFFRTLL